MNPNCECQLCKNDLNFILDDFLLSEIRNQNIAIFAGAGVSTENPNSSPHSLYLEMANKCGIENCDLPFPDLAQVFSDRPDGRFELLKLIQKRFDNIQQFRDLRRQATKFFDEISTMPYFRTFITTNWDRYFEDYCSAKPFVNDSDMRFWDIPYRRVLKIHGTIDDYSSLIATREDYDSCSIRLANSLVGGKLKDILNTQTCIFIGYSLLDDDFKEIFEFVRNGQGQFAKTHYIVNPNIGDELPYPNLTAIKTDGTYFLSVIKDHFASSDCYLNDEIYDHVYDDLIDVEEAHTALWEKYDPHNFPQMLMSAVYQDGLIHGYEVILDKKNEGRNSDLHYLQAKLYGYQDIISDCIRSKKYLDVAYFRGYQNVIVSLIEYKDSGKYFSAPMYFYPKVEEMNFNKFKKVLQKLPQIHKTAFKQCEMAIKKLPIDSGMVIQHSPWM